METSTLEDAFQVGDVVRPKSGGRHMTVVAIREQSEGVAIECAWFKTQAMGGEAHNAGLLSASGTR